MSIRHDISKYVTVFKGEIMITNNQNNKQEPSFATGIDKDDKLVIIVDVVGVAKKDIKLKRHKQTLTIAFERVKEAGIEYSDNTIEFGEFAKSFKVPEVFDLTKRVTSVKNGTLTITLEADDAQVETIKL